MKKFLHLGAALFIAVSALQASAQNDNAVSSRYFLEYKDAPSSLRILPPPPADSTARFAYDREQYEWGKSLRDTPRGRQAVADANLDPASGWADTAFSEAFGMSITPQNTPAIAALVYKLQEDAGDLATREAKQHYMRTRPFVYWNEPTATPGDEDALRRNGSYPSGHTAIGWATALVLAEINPARATEILKRGFEFGQSRVIVGAHYQSDVDAGRVVGAGIVPVLHNNPEFMKALAAAKAEFAAKSGKAACCRKAPCGKTDCERTECKKTECKKTECKRTECKKTECKKAPSCPQEKHCR